MRWRDGRDGRLPDIRARSNLPGDVRSRQRQLGRVWIPMEEVMAKKGVCPQGVRMGANGFRNELYFIKDGDIRILFRGSVVPGQRVTRAATEDFNQLRIEQSVVDKMLRLQC